MKKLTFIAMALMCLFLSACNDDAEKNDTAIAQQLPGRWMLTYSSDNTSNEIYYSFTADSKFRYTSTSTKLGETLVKSAVIDGTWRVYKGVVQFKYDLDTFSSSGLTEAEKRTMYDGFYQSNLLLEDMENSGQPFGYTVTFGTNGTTDTMRLSSINGMFVRVSY